MNQEIKIMEALNFTKKGELWVSDHVEAGEEGKIWFEIDFVEVPVNIIVEATGNPGKGTWARVYGQKFHYKTWGEGVCDAYEGMYFRILLSVKPVRAEYIAE